MRPLRSLKAESSGAANGGKPAAGSKLKPYLARLLEQLGPGTAVCSRSGERVAQLFSPDDLDVEYAKVRGRVGDEELYILDPSEADALLDYRALHGEIPDTVPPPPPLAEGVSLRAGGYRLRNCILYVGAGAAPLEADMVETIKDFSSPEENGSAEAAPEREAGAADEVDADGEDGEPAWDVILWTETTADGRVGNRCLWIPARSELIRALVYYHPDGRERLVSPSARVQTSEDGTQIVHKPLSDSPEEIQVAQMEKDRTINRLAEIGQAVAEETQLREEEKEEAHYLVEDTIGKACDDMNMLSQLVNEPNAAERDFAEQIFKVNVVTIQVALSMQDSLALTKDQIRDMGVAALLQDLGMYQAGLRKLISKERPLTSADIDLIREHPKKSIEMAGLHADRENLHASIMQGHEKLDGSGYPAGLAGEQVLLCPRILAVANSYVAMTTDRQYRPALDFHTAMVNLIYAAAADQVDKKVVKGLLDLYSIFPVGSLVQMKTGAIARVIAVNETRNTRPLIRVICDADKQPYDDKEEIDLSLRPDIKVVPYAGLLDVEVA